MDSTDTYALKQLGMSLYIALTSHQNPQLALTSGMHLEPGNKQKDMKKTCIFTLEKKSKNNWLILSVFR